MTLQRRTLLIITSTLSLLLASLYYFVDRILLTEFRAIENRTVEQHVSRVLHSFENVQQQLASKVGDWAAWDDTYEFIVAGGPKYVEETFNFLTLSALNLRHLVYFDADGKVKYDNEVFYRQERVDHVPPATLERLKSIPLALRENEPTRTGILSLPEALVLYVTAPIVDSKKEKPSRGSLLGTIEVTPAMLRDVARQTNLTLTAFRLGIDQLGAPESRAVELLSSGQSSLVQEAGKELLHGYGLLRSISGSPALLFRVDNPRSIYRQALSVRAFMLGSLTAAGLIWALLTAWMLNRWLLRPLTHLSARVREIATAGSARLRLETLDQGHSLKVRAVLILGTTMLLMIVALSLVFSPALTGEFATIEANEMQDNLERVQRALAERASDLRGKTVDWAQWDDTYQFVIDQNPEYDQANIIYETLTAIHMSYVLYFNTEKKLVTGRAVDYAQEHVDHLADSDSQVVNPFRRFLEGPDEPRTGWVEVNGKVYLTATSPIVDTSRTQPSRGYFIFATPLDTDFVDALSRQTQLKLDTTDAPAGASRGATSGSSTPTLASATEVRGQLPIMNSAGEHLLTVTITSPRDVYLQGIKSRNLLTLWLIGVSIVFLAVTLFAIQRWVIARVDALKRELLTIGAGTAQPHDSGAMDRDELSRLSNDINAMLSALDNAQGEIVKARDAAEAANHAKSSFIAKVSHELRTPIHSIIGMLRIVLRDEQNSSRRTHLGMARDAAYALLGTINDILDFSKAEAGMLSVTPVEFSLRAMLRESLRTVGPRAYERDGLELLCDMRADFPDAFIGDPVRLKQVFVNLLGNSVKFTTRGNVTLRLSAEDPSATKPTLRFDISDTGIGIPADRLPTIFEPFTQADNSVVRRYQGTGLGLTIVKQLIEAMGGTISVQSTEGKGSCFTILLPLERVPGSTERFSRADLSETPIIVLDHYDVRAESLMETFAQHGAVAPLCAFPAIPPTKALVVITGEQLTVPTTWVQIERHAKLTGAANVIALLTPYQLTLREKLSALGITRILTRPALPSDILEAVTGTLDFALVQPTAEEDAIEPTTTPLRILIADDTPTNQIILRDLLEEAGHTVTAVSNGQQILDALAPTLTAGQPSIYDVLLTDVQMPEMDGVTATMKIRDFERRHPGLHLPICAVTAHAFPEERNRILQAGADGVVTKPIEPAALRKTIQTVTANRPLRKSNSGKMVAPSALPAKPKGPSEAELFEVANKVLTTSIHIDPTLDLSAPEQVLDIQALFKRSGNSPRRTLLILGAFVSGQEALLERLRATRESPDVAELRNAAHALRGALMEAGATKIAEIATTIEQLCDTGKYDEAVALRDSLERGTLVLAKVAQEIHSGAAAS